MNVDTTYARKEILDFFAINDRVTDFSPRAMKHHLFEDTMSFTLQYNNPWQKLLPHVDKDPSTIDVELIDNFAQARDILPVWQTKKANNDNTLEERNKPLFDVIQLREYSYWKNYYIKDQTKNPFSNAK